MRPLEQFEQLRRRAVRFGDRLADLSYPNPYEGVARDTRAILRRALDEERVLDLQYTPFGGSTLARRAVADALRESHGAPFKFRDVVLTTGATAALHIAMHGACEPGDEVIIPVPCWMDYPLYADTLGLKPVLVPLAAPDFDLDVDAIAAAVTPATRAVLITQPGNPTGRLYGADSLDRLAESILAASTDERPITLISDETHRDFADPNAYHSPIHAYARSLMVYSFGKYHFLQGQRLGYVAIPPSHPQREELGVELPRWTRASGLTTPTSLMQRALPDLLTLRHPTDWLGPLRERFERELTAADYEVVHADATFFVYVRTPEGVGDFEFIERLAKQGLLVLPAPVFHHSGYFRLALTGSDEMTERALAVLGEAA
jgi:aspartate aminotransferase